VSVANNAKGGGGGGGGGGGKSGGGGGGGGDNNVAETNTALNSGQQMELKQFIGGKYDPASKTLNMEGVAAALSFADFNNRAFVGKCY
jgi:hypothetical protein